MLAKRVAVLPEGPGWIFEPKWDGFRALVFRDHGEVTIQSRDENSTASWRSRPRVRTSPTSGPCSRSNTSVNVTADCTFAQLEVVPPLELETIFAMGR
jgi:hypothetical protein